MTQQDETLSLAAAEDLIAAALAASNTSEDNARATARALVAAEADGHKGHGFSRVSAYAAQARSGKVDGWARPQIARPRPGFLTVDAGNGFAYPALEAVRGSLIEAAKETGVACAAIRRSHHCGALGTQVEKIAEAGLVALMVANTPKAMAAWGGRAALFGTNPIAFAAPADPAPLVIDLSLSHVARGRVMAAAQRGESIPEGWALDANGAPTTDPKAALAGTMLPAGGAKGAALALMVETLAAALTGAAFSWEATSFFDAEGAPPSVGQFVLAIDPRSDSASGADLGGGFAARMGVLLSMTAQEPGTRPPGMRRLTARKKASERGLTANFALIQELKTLAKNRV